MTLKILFWNILSIKACRHELQQILKYVGIFMGVESWLCPKDNFIIPCFNTYRKDRENLRGVRLIFLARTHFKFFYIDEISPQTPDVETAGFRMTNTISA